MDGAAKFVRGDAIAGLIITCINIVGGLTIGVAQHGLAFADAISTYTTLTIGDGLVSQIPALLVSTAAGIVVTKGGMEGTADVALVRQLGRQPQTAGIGRRCGRRSGAAARIADAAIPGAVRTCGRRGVGALQASACGTGRTPRQRPPSLPNRRSARHSAST